MASLSPRQIFPDVFDRAPGTSLNLEKPQYRLAWFLNRFRSHYLGTRAGIWWGCPLLLVTLALDVRGAHILAVLRHR
jgi:hypothetical protein